VRALPFRSRRRHQLSRRRDALAREDPREARPAQHGRVEATPLYTDKSETLLRHA
jgi:hypothetical protein